MRCPKEAPYSGAPSRISESGGRVGTIQLRKNASMHFYHRHVDGNCFHTGLDLLLIASMAKLAFGFDVHALGEFSGRPQTILLKPKLVPRGSSLRIRRIG